MMYPRKPTQKELDDLEAQIIVELRGLWPDHPIYKQVKEAKSLIRQAQIAVFEDFQVGHPSDPAPFFGSLMIVFWQPNQDIWVDRDDTANLSLITWLDGDCIFSYRIGDMHTGLRLPEAVTKRYENKSDVWL